MLQFRAKTKQRVIRELKEPEYPNAAPSCLKDDLMNSNSDVVNTKSENDLAEWSYTTVRKNDRICDLEQFAS